MSTFCYLPLTLETAVTFLMGTLELVSIAVPVNVVYSRSQNQGWGLLEEAVNVSLPDPIGISVCLKEMFSFSFSLGKSCGNKW